MRTEPLTIAQLAAAKAADSVFNRVQWRLEDLHDLAATCNYPPSAIMFAAAAMNLAIRFGLPGESRVESHELAAIVGCLDAFAQYIDETTPHKYMAESLVGDVQNILWERINALTN
jgi:hypothetical protein